MCHCESVKSENDEPQVFAVGQKQQQKSIEIIFLAHVAPLRAASSKDTDTERQTFATHTHTCTYLITQMDRS